jgi:hypothetical protein
MHMKHAVFAFWTLLICAVSWADPPDAFQQGQSFASGQTGAAASNVTTGSGQSVIPNFGGNPPEQSYFQGGQGQLFGHGQSKLTGCASGPTASSAYQQQECDAVNFLAKNPENRLRFDVNKNDPLIVGSDSVIRDPSAIAGSTGSSYANCTTTTDTTPGKYENETCTEYATTDTSNCTVGRIVEVDADSNFQCRRTVNAYETLTCDDSSVGCTQTGTTLQCADTSTLCYSGSDSCCWITVTCAGAGTSATVRHGDCCGYTFTQTITNTTEFLSGISYNPAGAKITCDTAGKCKISMEIYYCNNPSASIGHYDNVNSFNMTTRPTWSCTTGGGCEALDARTN